MHDVTKGLGFSEHWILPRADKSPDLPWCLPQPVTGYLTDSKPLLRLQHPYPSPLLRQYTPVGGILDPQVIIVPTNSPSPTPPSINVTCYNYDALLRQMWATQNDAATASSLAGSDTGKVSTRRLCGAARARVARARRAGRGSLGRRGSGRVAVTSAHCVQPCFGRGAKPARLYRATLLWTRRQAGPPVPCNPALDAAPSRTACTVQPCFGRGAKPARLYACPRPVQLLAIANYSLQKDIDIVQARAPPPSPLAPCCHGRCCVCAVGSAGSAVPPIPPLSADRPCAPARGWRAERRHVGVQPAAL